MSPVRSSHTPARPGPVLRARPSPPQPEVRRSRALQVATILKALSDPTRIRIMDCLLAGERCVTDLATTLELNQPRVSHHLGVLRRHSLVVVRRDGKHVFYRVDPRWRPEADATGRELHLGPITLRFRA